MDEMVLRLLEITTPTGKLEDIGLGPGKSHPPNATKMWYKFVLELFGPEGSKRFCFCLLPFSAIHCTWKSMSVDQVPL